MKIIIALAVLLIIGAGVYLYSKNNSLNNNYQLSLMGLGKAEFKVFTNGLEAKKFRMTDPENRTISALLDLDEGKNDINIEITPSQEGQEYSYSYKFFKFAKGNSDPYAIFNDENVIYTSTPEGEIVGFVDATEKTTLTFEIVAD